MDFGELRSAVHGKDSDQIKKILKAWDGDVDIVMNYVCENCPDINLSQWKCARHINDQPLRVLKYTDKSPMIKYIQVGKTRIPSVAVGAGSSLYQ